MASSKVTTVTDILMARIVNGEYKGTIPPQDALSSTLEVSRNVVREAISKLEAWHVVTVRPKTGTAINPAKTWALVNIDVVKNRLGIEGFVLDTDTTAMILGEIRTALLAAGIKDALDVDTV